MSGLRVAVTRAAPENARTATRLQALGAEPVLAPLLTIEPREFDTSLSGVQALLFSSSNGVRAFAQASPARDRPVLAVGDATADAARAAGFADVRSANGDVGALAALAQASFATTGGALLQVSGVEAAGQLTAELDAVGFEAERRIAYEARAVTALPAGFGEPLDVVLFHSARAADIFVRLGKQRAAGLIAGCLSANVAHAAASAPWTRVIVAPAPREDVLLAATLRN